MGSSRANINMDKLWNILFLTFALGWLSVETAPGLDHGSKLCFPNDFLWGVATAAFQIEGAWNTSGKGENIWDRLTHSHPEVIVDRSNGDVADDSYHQVQGDIRLLQQLGVQFYRFSMSWSRILPTGFSNEVNEDGIRYYMEVIDGLHAAGIQPMVTIYHWDLPQPLQELGGWTNPIVAHIFVDYAKVLFTRFGHKVKNWITFNEPLTFCEGGYGNDEAPGAMASGLEDYLCGHTILRAHGMAYRMFQNEFKHTIGGNVGITLGMSWMEPATASDIDEEAAEIVRQFHLGWFAHPIFSKSGDYPPIMRQKIDDYSNRQHYSRSRLPSFTAEEIEVIRGSADFLGLNHYTTYLVAKGDGKADMKPSYWNDLEGVMTQNPEWPSTNSTWMKIVPWGFRKVMNWVKKNYDNPVTLITENGFPLEAGLQDTTRVAYLDAYLRNMHAAITVDGCNVLGYTYWSLMDNFEWLRGYTERYGLFEVDYSSPNRTRTARLSARHYADIARTGCLPPKEHHTVNSI